jgi:hypothetical protein
MKITKKQALIAISKIRDTYPDEYSLLLEYIDPFRNVKAVSDILRIHKAAGGDNRWSGMEHLYFDGKLVSATDGQRLHVLENSEILKVGFYNEKLEYLGNGFKFPNVERVLSTNDFKQNLTVKINQLIRGKEGKFETATLPTGEKVNYKFLKDALNGLKEFTYYFDESKRLIVIKDGNFTAIIMTMGAK